MIAAMILSLIIGLLAGYLAAVNRRWNMLILPAADILQSVPVLGFFPAAVFFFIRIFGRTYPAIGVETRRDLSDHHERAVESDLRRL